MTTAKIAVTVPQELVDDARQAVENGAAPSMSAYVTSALDAYRHRQTLDELLAEIDEQEGEVDSESQYWASRELNRVEHELTRSHDQ